MMSPTELWRARTEQTVPHRQPLAAHSLAEKARMADCVPAAWWVEEKKKQTKHAFASVLPCNGCAASRPSLKVPSKFLVSPLGQQSSESKLAFVAIAFPAAASCEGDTLVLLTRVSTCSSSTGFGSHCASLQASSRRKTLVFIVKSLERAAIR